MGSPELPPEETVLTLTVTRRPPAVWSVEGREESTDPQLIVDACWHASTYLGTLIAQRAQQAGIDHRTQPDNPEHLTNAQLDGLACVVCGAQYTESVPVGAGPGGGQLFACASPAVGREISCAAQWRARHVT